MKKNIFFQALIILTCLISPAFCAYGVEETASDAKLRVAEGLTELSTPWESSSISGKFKMKGLPLSPSLKIYMQRDSLVIISLRAPFVGEVGRCEITPDSVLVVNKMKKTYCLEPIEEVRKFYPGTIADIQELLLGRIVIPGMETGPDNIIRFTEVYEEDDAFALVPGEEIEVDGFSYGYLLDFLFRPTLLLVIPDDRPDINFTLEYAYAKKGYDITATYNSPEAVYTATLELDSPEFGVAPTERIKINNKFRRLEFSQFIKSF